VPQVHYNSPGRAEVSLFNTRQPAILTLEGIGGFHDGSLERDPLFFPRRLSTNTQNEIPRSFFFSFPGVSAMFGLGPEHLKTVVGGSCGSDG
jgi:hypothetical protein